MQLSNAPKRTNPKPGARASNRAYDKPTTTHHHGETTMKRYPHTTPWKPALGLATLASVATLAVAVVLPAIAGGPGETAYVAERDVKAATVTVTLERVDLLTARASSVAPASRERT
jgi:hypothetical protein